MCNSGFCANITPQYIEVGITSDVIFNCSRSEVIDPVVGQLQWVVPAGAVCLTSCSLLPPGVIPECDFLQGSSCKCYNEDTEVACNQPYKSIEFISGTASLEYIGNWRCEDSNRNGVDIILQEFGKLLNLNNLYLNLNSALYNF